MSQLKLELFPHRISCPLRYSDTDKQGHVNNAVFATFIEMGRVDMVYSAEVPLHDETTHYVVVNYNINFHKELTWPANIEIGSSLIKIGNSSMTFFHGIFVDDVCYSTGTSVCVHADIAKRASTPLSQKARGYLEKYLTPELAEFT